MPLTRAHAAKFMGISINADAEEIKKAYKKLALQYHPDKADANGLSHEEAEKRFKELAAAYSKMTGKDDDEENDDGGAFYVDPYDIFEMIFLQKISGGGGFGFSRSQKRGMARADLPQHFDPMDIFGELFSVPNAGPRRKGFYPRKSVSQKGKATVKVESDDEDEDEDDDGGDEDEDEENEDEEEGDEDEIEEEDEGDKDEDDDDARVRR